MKFESDMLLIAVRWEWTSVGPMFETTVRNLAVKVPRVRTAVKAEPKVVTQL
jgi:hypothetical protein